jgi:hypothetical protein
MNLIDTIMVLALGILASWILISKFALKSSKQKDSCGCASKCSEKISGPKKS